MIGHPVKVVVCGPAGVGKTTLIRTLSTTEVINTDEQATEEGIGGVTTVALDFGTLPHEAATIHLFGTPGQERFDFMWDILCNGAVGLIGLVAGDQPGAFTRARRMLDHITSQVPIPWVLGVTKRDLKDVWAPEDVAMFFDLTPNMVMSLDTRQRDEGLNLLSLLFERIAAGDGVSRIGARRIRARQIGVCRNMNAAGRPMTLNESLQDVMRWLRDVIPGFRGALVATSDGMPICHVLGSEESARVASMAAAGLGLGRRICSEVAGGDYTHTTVSGDMQDLHLYSAGPLGVLAILAAPRVNEGLIQLAAPAAARRVADILSEFETTRV